MQAKNKLNVKRRPGLRVQVNINPEESKVVQGIAAKFRKETGSEWSLLDVVTSCFRTGLAVKEKTVLKRESVALRGGE